MPLGLVVPLLTGGLTAWILVGNYCELSLLYMLLIMFFAWRGISEAWEAGNMAGVVVVPLASYSCSSSPFDLI